MSSEGTPLASATVLIEGLNLGTLSREDGRYTIAVPGARVRGQRVQITARRVGYRAETVPITLTNGVITQDFRLDVNPLRLGEQVVTGAGTVTTQEKLGVAIDRVGSEAIERSNEANVVNALAAKAPNVLVTSQSGEPGASSYIQIRGAKSIQGTGQPLFVVDGTPIDNTTLSTGSFLASTVSPNRASDINPADIESVEILKGAAASAIYGARAANGVVLITTKSGRSGQTRFSLRSSTSIDKVSQGVPLQRSFGQGFGGVASTTSAYSFGPPISGESFDHWSEMFETGYSFDNTLTVSGGNERTTFYLSGSRLDQNGTIVGPKNWYDRTSLRLKGTHRLLDNLQVGGNVSYVDARGEFIQKGSNISGLLLGALRTPPSFNNQNWLDTLPSGQILHRSYRVQNPVSVASPRGYDNPFWVVNMFTNSSDLNRSYGNINAEYQPTNWLQFRYTFGADYYTDSRLEGQPPSSSNFPAGQILRADFTNYQWDHNLLGTANWRLNPDVEGTFTLGQNLNSRTFRQLYVTGTSWIATEDPLQLDNTIDQVPDEYESVVHTESYFGQATVDLYNQLFLTGAVRNDGFSTFAQSDRRHWFPKVSAAWTFTEAFQPGDWLEFGKLRAAWGIAGREPGVYVTLPSYSLGIIQDSWGPYLRPVQGGNGGTRTGGTLAQPNIQPERTREVEVGLDLGLIRNKVDLGLTYYDSRSEDVIFTAPLAPSSGYTSQANNAATISNKGFEVVFNARPITTPDLSWDFGVTWSRNRNKVLDLAGFDFIDINGAFAGAPTTAFEGYGVGVIRGNDFARCGRGLNIDGMDIDALCGNAAAGALFIGDDGFPILDPNTRVISDPEPDWQAGIRTSLTLFKRLQVSGLLDIRQGGTIWNGTKGALYNFGTHKDTEIRGQQVVFGEDWMPQATAGPGAGTSVVLDENWFAGLGSGFGPVASQFIEDGSFVKLREIALGYTFDQPFVRQRLGLSSIDVRVAGRNLHTWTDYTGIDPETNLAGAETQAQGVDYFNNPQTRSFVFTLTLNR
jgi:TonB-linked SusC/RagA family outer membrane protein